MRYALAFALLVMGFTSIMVQVVVLRELLVDFLGNELSVGIILADWLLVEGLGSWTSGKLSRRFPRPTLLYVVLQMTMAALLPLAVVEARLLRNLAGFVPGQGAGLPSIAYLSFLILAPLAFCDGAQFTLGCGIFSSGGGQELSIGSVYVLEALGSVASGIAATYIFLPLTTSITATFLVGIVNLSSSLLLIQIRDRWVGSWARILAILSALGLLTMALMIVFSKASLIEDVTLRARWKGYRLIESKNSVYGNIAVIEQAGQITFFVGGVATLTSPVPDTELARNLVHISLLAQGYPRRVLVVGGGAGGVLSEILRHDAREIVYVEQDPLLIELVRRHHSNITEYELKDPRVRVETTDGRRFLAQTGQMFDVILMNLPYPSSITLNRFYTTEFFRLANSRLSPGGLLAFPIPGAAGYLSADERRMNKCILEALNASFGQVKVVPGTPSIVLASDGINLSQVDAKTLCERSRQMGLDSILPCQLIAHLLDPARQNWYWDSVEAVQAKANRDLIPSGVFYSLSYWTSIFSPNMLWAIRLLERASALGILGTIGVLGSTFVCFRRVLKAAGLLPVPVLVVTTGFFGMGTNIALIIIYQSFFGYLYQEIGLIFTAFMLGLSLGGTITNRLLARGKGPGLVGLEVAIVAFCPTLILLLPPLAVLAGTQKLAWLSKILILGLSAASGFLVGAEFPVSSRARLAETGNLPRVAGAMYAWDLLGAVLGSVLFSIAVVPLAGVTAACLCLMALKLLSLGVLLAAR